MWEWLSVRIFPRKILSVIGYQLKEGVIRRKPLLRKLTTNNQSELGIAVGVGLVPTFVGLGSPTQRDNHKGRFPLQEF